MAALNYKISSFCFLAVFFTAKVCVAGEENLDHVKIDNALSSCIDISENEMVEDASKLALDTIWNNKSQIGGCGCKSAAISYSVKLIDSGKLISYGVISSFDKENFKFVINHDSSIKYKNGFELSINCLSQ